MIKASSLSPMKRIAAVAVSALVACSLFMLAGCSSQSSSSSSASSATTTDNGTKVKPATANIPEEDLMKGIHHATLEVEGYEPITIELNADAAPISVTNFANLVNEGYYNGLSFYRIVDDFCLQGGTKGNNAAGKDDELDTITGEFSSNGVDNPMADDFGYGTVAMARTSIPNSATSTFFITLGDDDMVGQSLNGQYAAFGTIDAGGMVTIEKIVADYLPNVDDAQMGAISDESKQAIIKSITMVD